LIRCGLDNDSGRFRQWAAEHPKRYLAGAISVGTVDQVLLSALMVSHSDLRATSLLRQFLVVDEVHASDAYMATILRQVLYFHLTAGGHALLLSATLGSQATTRLISASWAAPPKSRPMLRPKRSPIQS
jgi:CRISPR-associated endonuclease/helicase Cas3